MSKHGKKYLAAQAKIEAEKNYSPSDAVALAKETSSTKFDATVELHLNMGLDPRQADQLVRDVVVLPHGLGKSVDAFEVAEEEGASIAREAGADAVADDDETLKKIQGGWTDFDVAISTPEMMGKVGRLGRVLGPRGLMPNPKAGTVVNSDDLGKAVQEAKAGRVEFRLDKTANIHCPIGKVSFSEKQLFENLASLMDAIKRARPAAAKGNYIKRVTLTTTMGPGIKLDLSQVQSMEVGE